MGIGSDFARGYALDRDGETLVTGSGNPREGSDPEMDNDTRGSGLSGDQVGSDDVLLSEDAPSELEDNFRQAAHANVLQNARRDDREDLETRDHSGGS